MIAYKGSKVCLKMEIENESEAFRRLQSYNFV